MDGKSRLKMLRYIRTSRYSPSKVVTDLCNNGPLINLAEAAELVGLDPDTYYYLCLRRKVPVYRLAFKAFITIGSTMTMMDWLVKQEQPCNLPEPERILDTPIYI
jgi:hypothetical protein